MDEQTVRKTFKYKLTPRPEQERELERVLGLCRALDNTALEQRITAWQVVRVSVSRFQQEAELKDIRADTPEYAAIHSHVLQDVLARLDKTYQVFFRRVQAGRKRAFRTTKDTTAGTRLPTKSSATAPRWTMASSLCRRSGASPYAGVSGHWGRYWGCPHFRGRTYLTDGLMQRLFLALGGLIVQARHERLATAKAIA
jgi:transposase